MWFYVGDINPETVFFIESLKNQIMFCQITILRDFFTELVSNNIFILQATTEGRCWPPQNLGHTKRTLKEGTTCLEDIWDAEKERKHFPKSS